MMENEGYDQVVGGSATPYITSLADDYGLATQSYALGHPSLPNYLALYSGSSQGVTQDEPPSSSGVFEAPTIASQMAAAGISMKAYAEDLPADPSSDSGSYVVHHDPWEYFTSPPPMADSSTLVGDLDGADAPDFVWFTPNAIDDGDSGAPQATILSDENAFLSSFVPAVQGTTWYQDGGQIVVDWDEGLDSDTSGSNGGDGGHVATIVVSAALKAAAQQDATPFDTTGLLHSIETAYGLPYLGGAAQAANGDMDELLDVSPTSATSSTTAPSTTTAPPTTTTAITPPSTTPVTATTTTPPSTTTTVTEVEPTTVPPPPTTTTVPPSPTTTAAAVAVTTTAPSEPAIDSTTTTAPPVTTKTATTTMVAPSRGAPDPPTTTGVGADPAGGSGGSHDPSVVSAPSTSLAFTGSGPGIRTLGIVGAGLALLGMALLALVGGPWRPVRRVALVDTDGRSLDGAEGDPQAPGVGRRDLWLTPPS
jgi:acid phosphatase